MPRDESGHEGKNDEGKNDPYHGLGAGNQHRFPCAEGGGASGSPVVSGPYWFLSSKEPSQAKGLPPILVFAVEVAKWSDGTAAPMHQE